MKKILLLALLCMPFTLFAKEKRDDSKYLAGAVPEVNGQVIFQQTFAAENKSQTEIYNVMKAYLQKLTKEENQLRRTQIILDDSVKGQFVGRFEEWMIFKKKPFNLDRTRFRYMFTINCTNGQCSMVINQISYYYEEDLEGNNGRTYRAEEWINDENALNKAKTKLLWGTGKFRRKTVDRVETIFTGAREAFEVPEPVVKPKATKIIK